MEARPPRSLREFCFRTPKASPACVPDSSSSLPPGAVRPSGGFLVARVTKRRGKRPCLSDSKSWALVRAAWARLPDRGVPSYIRGVALAAERFKPGAGAEIREIAKHAQEIVYGKRKAYKLRAR